MENTTLTLGHGAAASREDIQDILAHQVKGALEPAPSRTYEIVYGHPHFNQKTDGVCTAADLIDMAQQIFGVLFSVDFTYWGGKGYDGDLLEGSSNVSMLRHAKNVGFLPASMDPGCNNMNGGYSVFLSNRKAYTPEQIAAAGKYRIKGYARVLDMSAYGLASALQSSKWGLIVMIEVGNNWYSPSWRKSDLELLRAPSPVTSGHSSKILANDGTDPRAIFKFHNTWGDKDNPTMYPGGPIWSDDGDIRFQHDIQAPYIREAYVVLAEPFTFIHTFSVDMKEGDRNAEVVALQRVLVGAGFLSMPAGVAMGYFGPITMAAVKAFQEKYAHEILFPAGLSNPTGQVGPYTRAKLNSLFSQ